MKSRKIECIDSKYPNIELKKELCGLNGIPEVNRLCYIPCGKGKNLKSIDNFMNKKFQSSLSQKNSGQS